MEIHIFLRTNQEADNGNNIKLHLRENQKLFEDLSSKSSNQNHIFIYHFLMVVQID